MGHTLRYRTCQAIDPDREAAIRCAAEALNRGRSWVLAFTRDHGDGRLRCTMEPADDPDGRRPDGARARWPGAYEARSLLDRLCGISRECDVDWEIWAKYGPRPVGVIRGGECIDDPEGHADAVRAMREDLDRRADG
jgi:hypothetical protein